MLVALDRGLGAWTVTVPESPLCILLLVEFYLDLCFFFVRSYPVMSEDFVVNFYDNVFAFSQV